MMISSKGRYALRVMLDMAEQGGDSFLPLKDIADRQNISRKYLESIMGKTGGYKLTRKPEDYKVGEILCAAEGELVPVSCLTKDGKKCEKVDSCYTLPFWIGLEEHINSYVNSYTLKDLLESGEKNHDKCGGCTACGGKEVEAK